MTLDDIKSPIDIDRVIHDDRQWCDLIECDISVPESEHGSYMSWDNSHRHLKQRRETLAYLLTETRQRIIELERS